MEISKVENLRNGDEVYWNDPDHGATSRHIIIQSATIEEGSEIVTIYGQNGDYLECFAHELV